MSGTGVVQLLIGAVGLAQGARLLILAGRPDPDQWMGIDLSNKLVAHLFAGFFILMGTTAVVLAFVAPGSGR